EVAFLAAGAAVRQCYGCKAEKAKRPRPVTGGARVAGFARAGSVAPVARIELPLQVELNLRIRVGAKIRPAVVHGGAVMMGGMVRGVPSQRGGSHDTGCKHQRGDNGLHDILHGLNPGRTFFGARPSHIVVVRGKNSIGVASAYLELR